MVTQKPSTPDLKTLALFHVPQKRSRWFYPVGGARAALQSCRERGLDAGHQGRTLKLKRFFMFANSEPGSLACIPPPMLKRTKLGKVSWPGISTQGFLARHFHAPLVRSIGGEAQAMKPGGQAQAMKPNRLFGSIAGETRAMKPRGTT